MPFERCGKIVVATNEEEVPRLDELERRGQANGLGGVRRIGAEELREHEPHAAGVAALFVPETGIVDYKEVAQAYARELARRGGELRTGALATAISRRDGRVIVESTAGAVEARVLVACAGLASDRVARMAGLDVDVAIVPFRGEYWMLSPERANLVKNLIYPVPDPAFPFLGVHFTRRIGSAHSVEAGPNAVLALKREGYTRTSFDARDAWDVRDVAGLLEDGRQALARGDGRAVAIAVAERVRAGVRGARPRDHRARPRPRRRGRPRAGPRPERRAGRRLRDRRGRAHGPRAQRSLARGHRLAGDRRGNRRSRDGVAMMVGDARDAGRCRLDGRHHRCAPRVA